MDSGKSHKKKYGIRLANFVSRATGVPISEARQKIGKWKVTVDGKLIDNPDIIIAPWMNVTLNGQALKMPRAPIWLIVNKPLWYVTSEKDTKQGRNTYDLIPEKLGEVRPLGHLDFDVAGIVVFTDDIGILSALRKVDYYIPKSFEVVIQGHFDPREKEITRKGTMFGGLELKHGTIKKLETRQRDETWLFELKMGNYRDLRRFLSALGHEITFMKRVEYCGINIKDLDQGKYRRLSINEIKELIKYVHRK